MESVSIVLTESKHVFDVGAKRYDAWFDTPDGRVLFENELAAIRLLWRDEFRPALEVGVGTGRFAQALRVEFGVDPAMGALRLAKGRGVNVTLAQGEALPFPDAAFGGVLMIATLCFAEDGPALFREAARVLCPDGCLLIGDIPAGSPWGREYQRKGETGHPFYRAARFYAVEQLVAMMTEAGLWPLEYSSTLIQSKPGQVKPEPAQADCVERAGFVCVLARRA